ncbi:MAG: CDP-diacylglycerol--glycerol-3-phosphate 3-phosphatidyltransferase [Rickettsiales bacterium]|nr:CDP-diacylglycerol--glycerol-3-phosphate 3-phosphatidyltransferase [Rickettsiales bacterium]
MSIKQHIPNYLTYLRYLAVPVFVALWYVPDATWWPLIIFVFAAITDFFDGYLARKWNVTSELGRLLDPNADKLLVAAGLVMLTLHGYIHPAATILILCRELFVSGLREFMAERNITVHVTKLAKWKTTTQLIAIIVLLLGYGSQHADILLAGELLIWIATALTAITGIEYFRKSLPHLKD